MGFDTERIYYLSVTGDKDKRIDRFLSERLGDITRSRIQQFIKEGLVRVNGAIPKLSYQIRSGDRIIVTIPRPKKYKIEPEPINIYPLYEDNSIIVVNKPPGVVIHPAPGHMRGTLVHGLLNYCKDLSGIGGELRPGIVHRLDKDTSGVLIVAKNDRAHNSLSRQFKEGKVIKLYLAIVEGEIKNQKGKIDLPLGRHPKKRKKISVLNSGGRSAVTVWEKLEDLKYGLTYIAIKPLTGRTHQIRVHMAYIGHPVLGDSIYGHSKRRYIRMGLEIKRHMLHAQSIGFRHPETGKYVNFEAPIPDDIKEILNKTRK